ncbi:MAG TPA: sensor histidine kinase [Gammaproteobacteria bacterium]|nr:sensor histidine kinase [Gammaproteobacteria bacterium]
MSDDHSTHLAMLADHLVQQRDAVLNEWKDEAEQTGGNSALAEMSRSDFYDHMPEFLDRLNTTLRGGDVKETSETAKQHGAHRWQQGRRIDEVIQEWTLLHRVLGRRIGALWGQANLDPQAFQQAYQLMSEAIHNAIADSLGEYNTLLQVQAEARARDLEAVLERRDERDQLRSENLHEASHDLRGSLQSIRLASHILDHQPLDDKVRALVGRIRDAGDSLSRMLNDLLDLARLEAGRETRTVSGFNAAVLLQELCDGMQSAAESKGLTLQAHGPNTLRVRGDPMKVQRIAQNLILNALKYTSNGGVEVEWRQNSSRRWQFQVRDTGPGMATSSSGEYAANLEAANDQADDTQEQPGATRSQPPNADTDIAAHGEGIGLAIVHRLCELLDAVLQVESEPDRGTTFKVVLPTDYRNK